MTPAVTPSTRTPGVTPAVTPSTRTPGVTPGVTPPQGTTPSPPISPPIPPPSGWVFYIGAESGFGTAPSLTLDGQNIVTSWGPFTARNSPQFFSSGGPNNRPYVNFSGGSGLGRQYMSSQIQVSGRAGRTVFAYVLNTIGAPWARFLTGNFSGTQGGQYVVMGGGVSNFSFEIPPNATNAPTANYTTSGQWMTACWRSSAANQVTTKDIFYNGVKSASSQIVGTFPEPGNILQFGRSEFGDIHSDPYWSGKVYALVMYNVALSDDQIRGMDAYFRTLPSPTPAPSPTPPLTTPLSFN